MRSSPLQLFKIDLNSVSKRCGDCAHTRSYEISLSPEDSGQLRRSAAAILNWQPGTILQTEHVIDLLALAERISKERVFCKEKQGLISLLENRCSLWQPRSEVTTSTP